MSKLRKLLLAGLLTAALAAQPLLPGKVYEPALTAWWGTLYPGFCFGTSEKLSGTENRTETAKEHKVKISFWLAQALDW